MADGKFQKFVRSLFGKKSPEQQAAIDSIDEMQTAINQAVSQVIEAGEKDGVQTDKDYIMDREWQAKVNKMAAEAFVDGKDPDAVIAAMNASRPSRLAARQRGETGSHVDKAVDAYDQAMTGGLKRAVQALSKMYGLDKIEKANRAAESEALSWYNKGQPKGKGGQEPKGDSSTLAAMAKRRGARG